MNSTSTKRLLVPIATGMSLRNVLRTDLHGELVSRGLVPVYLVPEPIVSRLAAELTGEPAEVGPLPAYEKHRLDTTLGDLAFAAVHNRHRLETIELVRRRLQRNDPRRPLKERLYPLVGRSRAAYRLLSRIRESVFRAPEMDRVIDRHAPDLVFSNNIFHPVEAAVLHRARLRGIPTVGMVLSWDNPSNKGVLPARPDRTLVWSEVMAWEMREYFGLADPEMEIVGSPQFDAYCRDLPRTRKDVLGTYGFESDRRLILYATGALGHYVKEYRYPTALADALDRGAFGRARLLVRLHPRDKRERYEGLLGRPGVVVSGAGGETAAYVDRWYPSREDHEHYAALLRHADVMVNMASTVALEAAANDTPVVNVAWEIEPDGEYLDSARRLFEFTHTKRLLGVGATTVVTSESAMIDAVIEALANPGHLEERRAALAALEGFTRAGDSARRIAACLGRIRTRG